MKRGTLVGSRRKMMTPRFKVLYDIAVATVPDGASQEEIAQRFGELVADDCATLCVGAAVHYELSFDEVEGAIGIRAANFCEKLIKNYFT